VLKSLRADLHRVTNDEPRDERDYVSDEGVYASAKAFIALYDEFHANDVRPEYDGPG
jgi:hypothetical protein